MENIITMILHGVVYVIFVPLFSFILRQQIVQYNDVTKKLARLNEALATLDEINKTVIELQSAVNTINTHLDYINTFKDDTKTNYDELRTEVKVLNDKLIELMGTVKTVTNLLDK